MNERWRVRAWAMRNGTLNRRKCTMIATHTHKKTPIKVSLLCEVSTKKKSIIEILEAKPIMNMNANIPTHTQRERDKKI